MNEMQLFLGSVFAAVSVLNVFNMVRAESYRVFLLSWVALAFSIYSSVRGFALAFS